MAGLLAAVRRLRSHAERDEHIRLAKLFDHYLDKSHTFWSSIENRPISAVSGRYQKLTGVRAGLPDILILHRGNNGIVVVFIELKSRTGAFTAVQRRVREELLAVGALWFAARSARAALAALARAGIPFCRKWREPVLPAWEGPATEPKRLAFPPDVAEERLAWQRGYDTRARARKAAERAATQATQGA